MKKHLLVVLFLLFIVFTKAQNIGVNTSGATPNAAALLDIDATGTSPKLGLLIPRMLASEKAAITLTAPAQGLVVYQTDGVQGFYYNTSTTTTPAWSYLSPSNAGWTTAGNTLTGNEWIGSINAFDWVVKTNSLTRMTVQSGGNVGIGTTGPANRLVVTTSTANDGIMGTDGTRWMKLLGGTVATGSFNGIVQANDNAIIYSGGTLGTGAFTIAPWASGTSGFRMDNNGNVGIGISAPAQALHVVGTERVSTLASGASGAILTSNTNGDIGKTNFSGNANQVLLGNNTFGAVPTNTAWSLTGGNTLTGGTLPASPN